MPADVITTSQYCSYWPYHTCTSQDAENEIITTLSLYYLVKNWKYHKTIPDTSDCFEKKKPMERALTYDKLFQQFVSTRYSETETWFFIVLFVLKPPSFTAHTASYKLIFQLSVTVNLAVTAHHSNWKIAMIASGFQSEGSFNHASGIANQ